MLTQLSARNFKSWAAIDRMRLAPITGFFGTNSSGKSSILQLLLLIKQTVESSDRAAVLDFGDEKSLVSLGGFRDIVSGRVERGELEFGLSWDLPETKIVLDPAGKKAKIAFGGMGLHAKIAEDDLARPRVESFSYDAGRHRYTMRQSREGPDAYELVRESGDYDLERLEKGSRRDLPAPVKFYGFPDVVFREFRNAAFLADFRLYFEQELARVYYLGPLRDSPKRDYRWTGSPPADMGRRGERAVDAVLASRKAGRRSPESPESGGESLERRVASWLIRLGLVHEFRIEPTAAGANLYRVQVQNAAGAPEVQLPDIGFGVSQVLPVLALCYYVPEGSTILLEQPEIHLHPSAQMGLADVFIDAVKNRNIQIILESHSEYLLQRLQRRIAEEVVKPDEAALYFCTMAEGGSRLTPLDLDRFGNITNWPEHFFGDEFGEMAATTQAAMNRKRGGT